MAAPTASTDGGVVGMDEAAWTIEVTRPSVEWAAGHREFTEVIRRETRSGAVELAERAWLMQDREVRGAAVVTRGLMEAYDHPELSMLNVPGVFVRAAVGLVDRIARFVAEGNRVLGGETLGIGDDGVAFTLPDEPDLVGRVLRVIPIT